MYIKKQQSLRSLIQFAKKIYSQNPVRSSKEENLSPDDETDPSYVSMIFDKTPTKTKETGQVCFSEDYVKMS